MTTFCQKCGCMEHESCMKSFQGLMQCRKCLLYNENYYSAFYCDCGEWSDKYLKKLLNKEMMMPKCHVCKKTITEEKK